MAPPTITPAQPNTAANLLIFEPTGLEPNRRVYQRNPVAYPIVDLPQNRVDPEQLAKDLMAFVPIPSKSCRERNFTDRAIKELKTLGLEVREDNHVEKVRRLPKAERGDYYCAGNATPNSGNVIALLPATDPTLPSWNLSFHLDTNQTKFDKPDLVTVASEGTFFIMPVPGTPLGADDKAGLAIILEVLRVIKGMEKLHGEIRVVGLVGEEVGSLGAQLIDGEAFQGDFVVSVDGTNNHEIGIAAPTLYFGGITIETQTSHPAEMHSKLSVSACDLGAQILYEAGFRSHGQAVTPDFPQGNPDIRLLQYYSQCGINEGKKSADGRFPLATPAFNIVPPYWVAKWQMRSLEGEEKAAAFATHLRETVEKICNEAEKGRTPVKCTVTGTEEALLPGFRVSPDHPTARILKGGYDAIGESATITAQQFGGFNGNFVKSRFGVPMLIIDTGADQIHTNEETASVEGMARTARALLAAIVESSWYKRGIPSQMTIPGRGH